MDLNGKVVILFPGRYFDWSRAVKYFLGRTWAVFSRTGYKRMLLFLLSLGYAICFKHPHVYHTLYMFIDCNINA